jgi:hypothetical protein
MRHNNAFLQTRVPLKELANDAWKQPEAKLVLSCHECRGKRKASDSNLKATKRRQIEESRAVNVYSWDHVTTMIVNNTIHNLGKQIQISDFYRHLPAEVIREDQKAVAQFVVDQFATAGGYQFCYHHRYSLNKKPRGRTSFFSDAKVFRFVCSQNKPHKEWVATHQYGKTRNRRKRIQIYDCNGFVLVTFPTSNDGVPFDIVVENNHPSSHPGRDIFGVPLRVRKWIQQNPRTTPQAQREELIRAIEKRELEQVHERHLRPVIVHYWWRKAYKEKEYISDDSWINMEHILGKHPLVSSIILILLIYGRLPTLFSGQNHANT